jgi:hypothetical protein
MAFSKIERTEKMAQKKEPEEQVAVEASSSSTLIPSYPNKHVEQGQSPYGPTGDISCWNCEWFQRKIEGGNGNGPQQRSEPDYEGFCRAGHPINTIVNFKKTTSGSSSSSYYQNQDHAYVWDPTFEQGFQYWCRFWVRARNPYSFPQGPQPPQPPV